MKIFVTGATGFIGKHLVEQLVTEGNDLTINLTSKEKSPFSDLVKTYTLGEGDIKLDITFLKNNSFDGVIHLASFYLPVHQPEDILRLIDSNVRFSTYILECASISRIKWFINTGTFWQNFQNANYSPVNLYAATKQAFETIARYYIEAKQIKFATLRLCDTFGPGDTRPKIFTLWENIAKSGKSLDMSQGDQLIDISYIDDVVNAFSILSKHLNNNTIINNGEVYAVKADIRYTLKELAMIFEEVTGYKLNINWGKKSYREREVMVPWEDGVIVPGWRQKYDIITGIKKVFKTKSEE
jgi:nucleoside-diphosphate-sugar epimerase